MEGETDHQAASAGPDNDHTLIVVGQDTSGHHCVADNHGLMIDDFATHEDAVRYAFMERSRQPGAIVMVTPARFEPSSGRQNVSRNE